MDSRWGIRMVLLDNLLRPLEPVMILACASLYAGGAWGSFRMAEALVYLIYKLCLMGLDRGVIWGYGQTDFDRHRRDVLASMRAVGIVAIAGSGIMVLVSVLTSHSIKGMELSMGDILAQSVTIPLLAVSELLYQANINRREMIARIIGTDILIPFIVFGGAWLGHGMSSALTLSQWLLLGCTANFLLAVVSFGFVYRVRLGEWIGPVMPPRKLLRYGVPFLWADLLTGLVMRLDLMIVGELAGIKAVEVYNVIIMFSRSLQAIRQSFDGLLLSAFSREGTRCFTQDLRTRLNRANFGVMNLLGLALFLIAVWGQTFLRVLHPEYMEGYWPLVTISTMVFFNAFGDLGGVMLQGLGRSSAYSGAQIAGFIVNLGLNLLLVPRMGVFGGVLALGVAFTLQGALCQFYLWRGSRMVPWEWKYIRGIVFLSLWLTVFGAISSLLHPRIHREILTVVAVGSWGFLYYRRWLKHRDSPTG